MRPGQNKRMRGGRPNNNGGGNRKGPNPLTRSYESNGPDVKIRGNAHHVAEKYLQLARDAQSSGDPVAAESYLQHAEHYFRLIASAQAAQAGYARQPDAVDTEGEDEDDSGIPDRFASPQAPAPAPFVPQPAPQPYGSERQPYNGERQPYGERQYGQGGERQPYNGQGDRQPYNDRNGYGRQDRNNPNRRPFRDNGGDIRADDRQPGQPPNQGQNGDRPYGDRQSRRERFAQERLERQERQASTQANGGGQDRPQDRGQDRGSQDRGSQDRGSQDRPYGDRGYDRPRGGERYRDAQAVESTEPTADFAGGEQPRLEQPRMEQPRMEQPRMEQPRMEQPHSDVGPERRPETPYQPAPEPNPAPAFEAQPEARPEVQAEAAPRRSEGPRRRERVERPVPTPIEDAPDLPSFITAPPRAAVTLAEPAAAGTSLATATSFPGDDEEAPKFPRRRRRTTRAAGEATAGEATTGDAPAPAPGQPTAND